MASEGFSSERGSCYACGQRGHWARDCPSKRRGDRTSSGPSNNPPVVDEGLDYPECQCRCGRGACLVFTSRTAKNPGRKFYRCPVSSDACRFFMWCDTAVPVRSSKLANLKYPMCACGAGKCKLLVWNGGEKDGREYFACPLRKGQGACKFFQWVDAVERDHKVADSHLGESMSRSPHSAPYVLMDSEASNKPEDVPLHESITNEASPSPSPSTKGCAVKYENTHELLPPTKRPVLIVGKSIESSVQLVRENCKSFDCQDSEQSYPICACGAGRCSVLMWNIGDSAGRKYFACPVERGKGACNFFQWVSDVEGKHELAISHPGESNSWSPQSPSKELNDTEPMDKETSNTTEAELSNGSMANVPSSPSSKGCPVNNVTVIERLSLTDDESVESFVKLGQEAFNLLQCVNDIEGRHNLAISHPGESISWSSHSPSKEFNDSNSMDQETSNASDEDLPDGLMDNEPSSSPSNKGCPVNDVTTSDLVQTIQRLNLDDGEQVESFIEMGKGACNFFQWVSDVEEKHDLTISHLGESNLWSSHSSSKELNDTYSMDKETGDIIEEELLNVSMDNEPSSASSKGCPAHSVTAIQRLSLTDGESVESLVQSEQRTCNFFQCVNDIEGGHVPTLSHPGESISWSSHSPSKEFNDSYSMDKETSNVSEDELPGVSMNNESSSSLSNKVCLANDVTVCHPIPPIQNLNLNEDEPDERFIEMDSEIQKFIQWCDRGGPVQSCQDIASLYPTCACGDGMCSILTWSDGENACGTYCACPVERWLDHSENDNEISTDVSEGSNHSTPPPTESGEISEEDRVVRIEVSNQQDVKPSSPSSKEYLENAEPLSSTLSKEYVPENKKWLDHSEDDDNQISADVSEGINQCTPPPTASEEISEEDRVVRIKVSNQQDVKPSSSSSKECLENAEPLLSTLSKEYAPEHKKWLDHSEDDDNEISAYVSEGSNQSTPPPTASVEISEEDRVVRIEVSNQQDVNALPPSSSSSKECLDNAEPLSSTLSKENVLKHKKWLDHSEDDDNEISTDVSEGSNQSTPPTASEEISEEDCVVRIEVSNQQDVTPSSSSSKEYLENAEPLSSTLSKEYAPEHKKWLDHSEDDDNEISADVSEGSNQITPPPTASEEISEEDRVVCMEVSNQQDVNALPPLFPSSKECLENAQRLSSPLSKEYVAEHEKVTDFLPLIERLSSNNRPFNWCCCIVQ